MHSRQVAAAIGSGVASTVAAVKVVKTEVTNITHQTMLVVLHFAYLL